MEAVLNHNPRIAVERFNRSGAKECVPDWVLYLFIVTVFSKEIGTVFIAGIEYDVIGYTFCILYFLFYINRLFLNGYLNTFLLTLLLSSIAAKLYLSLPFTPLFKQWIPTTLIFVVCYDIITRVGNLKRVFKAYIAVSFYTALIGLLQLGLKFFFDIRIFTDYRAYFIDSIAREPSHYAAIILPACVYGIMCFKFDKWRSSVIILATVGTLSTTTFAVLMTVLVIIYLNPLYLIFIVPLMYLLYTNVLMEYDKFNERVTSMSMYLEGENMSKITNGTSLSFITNYEVAEFTAKQSPLIGSGLGGHEEMYQRYFGNSSFRYHYLFGLNSLSAHSLIIRIFSEWGLLGVGFYIFFQVKTLILNSGTFHRIISIACLSHFLCKFLKLGGYFDYGTPFFAILMWLNYVDYRKYVQAKSARKAVVRIDQ